MNDDRKEYLKQYKQENIKRIVLNVQNDTYDQIKLTAELDGVSVSRYIKSLIAADLKKKQGTYAYKIAVQRKSATCGPFDYGRSTKKQELEKVIFDSYDITGRYTGKAVALLTPEEAEKYREAQKEKSAQDKT